MVSKFKITFPTGYSGTDINNDYLDINIAFENGFVYCATLITLKRIQLFFDGGDPFFWWEDMVIVENLRQDTICEIVSISIEKGTFENVFCRIGTDFDQYNTTSFEEILDMNDYAGIYTVNDELKL